MTVPGVPAGWLLRPCGSWSQKGGLTTLVAYDPAVVPFDDGRRWTDINVGAVLTPELAEVLCAAYNGLSGAAGRQARGECAAQLRLFAAGLPGTGEEGRVREALEGIAEMWARRP